MKNTRTWRVLAIIFILPALVGCEGERSRGGIILTSPIWKVNATSSGGGLVEPAQQQVTRGLRARFTLTAQPGHSIESISGCDGSLSGNVYTTVRLRDGGCSLSVIFSSGAQRELYRVRVEGATGGLDVVTGGGLYAKGADAFLVTKAREDHHLAYWTEKGKIVSESETYRFTVDRERSLLANFAIDAYAVGGTVSGLTEGESLVLQNNGNDDLVVSSNGPFTFSMPLALGSTYKVTIAEQPRGRWCEVAGGKGVIGRTDIVSVTVGQCITLPPAIPLVSVSQNQDQLHFTWDPVTGASHYRLLESRDGPSGYRQIGADIPGSRVSHKISPQERGTARYRIEACSKVGCSTSGDIFAGQRLIAVADYIKASNAEELDRLGNSVALSADGMTLAVGSSSEDSGATTINGEEEDNSVSSNGAVYVFVREGAQWRQQAYIKPPDPERFGHFGSEIRLSGDGNTLAVGAPNKADKRGGVYLFTRLEGKWSHSTYLTGDATKPGDRFGDTLAISLDGKTLAVGVYAEDSLWESENSNSKLPLEDSGAVYIFTLSDGKWSKQVHLKGPKPTPHDAFGRSVALSADGQKLAVAAYGNDRPPRPYNAGAVHVFHRKGDGWFPEAYIRARNANEDDYFGSRIDLSADGRTLAVAAVAEDSAAKGVNGNDKNNSAHESGAVYVFVLAASEWTQQAYIKASNTRSRDWFGYDLSLSGNGHALLVGARIERSAASGLDGNEHNRSAEGAGAAYLFRRTGNSWGQHAYLKAPNMEAEDEFAIHVAISSDGNTLAATSYGDDSASTGIGGEQSDNSATDTGAVFVFTNVEDRTRVD